MKKYLIISLLVLLPIIAFAQFSGISGVSDFSPFRLSGTAMQPKVSSWTLGSSGTPIGNGFFTNLTTSVITISNSVTGNLTVNGGTINLGASPNTATTTIVANGSGQLTLSAAGTNQNVVLTPSGTGFTLLNGNVGIGTTNPINIFHIQGTPDGGGTLVNINANSGVTGQLLIGGSNIPASGSVRLASNSGANSGLNFVVKDSSGSANSQMVITGVGNVGIGTTSPGYLLHLGGSTNQFAIGNASRTAILNLSGNVLNFDTPGSTRMVMDMSNGNVGIGTTSPANLLHVAAGANATTTIEIGSQSTSAKTCFQIRNSNGTATRMYVNGTTLVIEAGNC